MLWLYHYGIPGICFINVLSIEAKMTITVFDEQRWFESADELAGIIIEISDMLFKSTVGILCKSAFYP